MKYGLTRAIDVYGFEIEDGETVISSAGDYLQADLWANKHLHEADTEQEYIYKIYARAWFCLKHLGLLEKYHIEDAAVLTVEILNDMTYKVSIYFSEIEENQLPLATQTVLPK